MASLTLPFSFTAWICTLLLLLPQVCSTAAPFSQYILAPPSRIVFPVSVHKVNGTVSNAASLTSITGTDSTTGIATFQGPSAVTFDFGKNVAGIVSVVVGNSTVNGSAVVQAGDAWIGVTFSESSMWISGVASDATADAGQDVPLWLPVGQGAGTYTVEPWFQRGGFRYLSLVANASATINVVSVWSNVTFSPDMEDLQAYTGYFNSDDELLNRIWYAGEFVLFFFG